MVGDVVVAKIVMIEKGVEVVVPIWAVSKEAVAKAVGEVAKDFSQIREQVAAFDVEVADRVQVTEDAVVVKITPINRGKMVGVCGNFNGERFDDMDVAVDKTVKMTDDFSRFSAPGKVQTEKMYMEPVSKKIERLFSKFTLE